MSEVKQARVGERMQKYFKKCDPAQVFPNFLTKNSIHEGIVQK